MGRIPVPALFVQTYRPPCIACGPNAPTLFHGSRQAALAWRIPGATPLRIHGDCSSTTMSVGK